MLTIFKISHLNSVLLDDQTLFDEINSSYKEYQDSYSLLSLWINSDERNEVFFKRYFNSLLFEYQLRFGKRLFERFPPIQNSKKYAKMPSLFWYNNHGIVEKLSFKEVSLKYQRDLVEHWKEYKPKWTKRWNSIEEALNFMKGAENDYK